MLVSTPNGDVDDATLGPGDMVNTIRGPMALAQLERRDWVIDNENETTHEIEFYLDGELMQRSVSVQLKKWPDGMSGVAQALFG